MLLTLPLVHDEGVVDRHADDIVNTVLFEFGCKLIVAKDEDLAHL
jgi:hypothetical protein